MIKPQCHQPGPGLEPRSSPRSTRLPVLTTGNASLPSWAATHAHHSVPEGRPGRVQSACPPELIGGQSAGHQSPSGSVVWPTSMMYPSGSRMLATDLVLVLLRRCQELGARGSSTRRTHRAWMSATRILRKLLTRSGSAWCLEGDSGLVIGRTSADIDDDEAVGQCDIGRLWAEDHRAPEHLGIEAPGALDVIGDDEVGHHHSQCGLRGFGHWHLHSLGPMPDFGRDLKPSVNYIGSSSEGLDS